MKTYLPALPEVIELEIEEITLYGLPEDDTFEVGGYDEFQMLAEHQAIKAQQKAKQHRELRRDLRAA